MSGGKLIPFVPKDKCQSCGHSWSITPGVHVMRCPVCGSSKITRANRDKIGLKKITRPKQK